ncbi:hypothetical protein BC834DRAFT_567328 [Gloeopeniophorella convolvens]|nr:hypothetical protein BC834DRAFT_567328 [Gloeopeniophorella convolvens]
MISSLLDLSPEIIIQIFSLLDAYDVHACHRTCRHLARIVSGSELLQYLQRVQLAGLSDHFPPGPTLPDRHDALTRLETAWRNLDLGGDYTATPYHASVPSMVHYVEHEIHDDFLIATDTSSRAPAVACYASIDLRLLAHPGAKDPSWRKFIFDYTPTQCHFSFAVEEADLVIITVYLGSNDSIRMVPVQFSTESIQVQSRSRWGIRFVLHAEPPSEWQRGIRALLGIVEVKQDSRAYALHFAMVTEDVIAFIRQADNALELCSLTGLPTPTPALKTLCVLSLPPLRNGVAISDAWCLADHLPIPLHQPTPPPAMRPPPSPPFKNYAPDALIGIMLGLLRAPRAAGPPERVLWLAAPRPALRRLARRAERAGLPVPWAEWGPRSAQVLPVREDEILHRPVGQRWLLASSDALVLRDFAPGCVRAADALPSLSFRELGEFWTDDAATCELPCAETRVPVGLWSRVLLDPTRLLLMRTQSGSQAGGGHSAVECRVYSMC